MPRAVVASPPSWSRAAHARNLTAAALRMTYRLRPHGAHNVGTTGSLLMVTSCEGVLAGSFVRALAPRPIHVIASTAMDEAVPAGALARAGDLALSGPGAVETQRRALAALDDERAVLIAGSAVEPGYLVAVTGVQVAPVVLIGADGKVATDPPRPRSTIDVYFFPPTEITVPGEPLRAATRGAVNELVRQLVADAGREAMLRAGGRS